MKSKVDKVSALFIELDALFDTRAATIYELAPDKVLDILTEDYYNRERDIFNGIDKEEFKKAYANRNIKTLSNSFITKFRNFINEFVSATTSNNINTPFVFIPKIIVNLYPYVLKDIDKQTLLNAVITITNKCADVELVELPYESITPSYVNNNLSTIVLYDYVRWLELHADNFSKISCPDVALIAPKIYFKELSSKEEQLAKTSKIDSFEAMRIIVEPFIALKLLDIEHFSLLLKVEKEE